MQETLGADAQPILESWDDAKWNAFMGEVAASNVYAWGRLYDDPYLMDGTQWTLQIYSENDAVVCAGSNLYPQEFDVLLAVMTKYFGEQVW